MLLKASGLDSTAVFTKEPRTLEALVLTIRRRRSTKRLWTFGMEHLMLQVTHLL